MAQRKGGDDIGLLVGLGILALVGIVYYSKVGRGEENDATLIPNDLEGKIDFVVKKLNEKFTKQWVDRGFNFISSYFQKTYPSLALVVNMVVYVEQSSRQQLVPMTSYAKQQAAVRLVRGY